MKSLILAAVVSTTAVGTVAPSGSEFLTTPRPGTLWIANSDNPYDQYGGFLRENLLAANEVFSTRPCSDEKICLKAWTQYVDKKYHADPRSYLTVNQGLIQWGQKEDQYRDRIELALSVPNGNQRLQQLKTLESEVARSYGGSPQEIETQKLMLLLITNIKYMSYTLQTEGIVVGEGPLVVAGRTISEWETAVDNCMRNKIDSVGPIEMMINYGAGPGGWVLVAYLDCCFTA